MGGQGKSSDRNPEGLIVSKRWGETVETTTGRTGDRNSNLRLPFGKAVSNLG